MKNFWKRVDDTVDDFLLYMGVKDHTILWLFGIFLAGVIIGAAF